jgi:2,4-dienoyl-CoA reductase (NADPH2)
METWWMKATAKHIGQTTDTMVTGLTDAGNGGVEVSLQQHTTGDAAQRHVDWVVCATPPRADDALWRALRHSGGYQVHRVGDCVAPRRAHAAVIEGERVGGAL